MSYVIYRHVQGVKLFLGYNDWELCKEDAITFSHFQAVAITTSMEDCEYEVVA